MIICIISRVVPTNKKRIRCEPTCRRTIICCINVTSVRPLRSVRHRRPQTRVNKRHGRPGRFPPKFPHAVHRRRRAPVYVAFAIDAKTCTDALGYRFRDGGGGGGGFDHVRCRRSARGNGLFVLTTRSAEGRLA